MCGATPCATRRTPGGDGWSSSPAPCGSRSRTTSWARCCSSRCRRSSCTGLDAWSPLVPPDWWVEAYYRRKRGDAPRKTSVVDDANSFADFAEYAYRYPAPLRRASDAEAGYRTSRRCKICGQGFETIRDLRLHHLLTSIPDEPLDCPKPSTHDPEVIKAYMSESRVEIICLVEGEDSIMSTCVRGLHSYQAPPLERLGRLRAIGYRLGRGLRAVRHAASQRVLSSGLRRLARSGRRPGRAPAASGVAVVNCDTEGLGLCFN